MDRGLIHDLVRQIPDAGLVDAAVAALQSSREHRRLSHLKMDDLLFAHQCIEQLIVLAWVESGDAAHGPLPEGKKKPPS